MEQVFKYLVNLYFISHVYYKWRKTQLDFKFSVKSQAEKLNSLLQYAKP